MVHSSSKLDKNSEFYLSLSTVVSEFHPRVPEIGNFTLENGADSSHWTEQKKH